MTGPIDVHTHIFASGWPDFAARHGGDRWPRLEGDPASGCTLYLGSAFNRTLTPHAFDPARRLEDMDRTGVDRQLLSPAPPTFCDWAPGPAAAEWCRVQNDAIAELVSRRPARFLGAGGLPLQAPDLAVKELERVATVLRFPAVEIGASVGGNDLDDESLAPVWDAAAALGIAIFVHPPASRPGLDRPRGGPAGARRSAEHVRAAILGGLAHPLAEGARVRARHLRAFADRARQRLPVQDGRGRPGERARRARPRRGRPAAAHRGQCPEVPRTALTRE